MEPIENRNVAADAATSQILDHLLSGVTSGTDGLLVRFRTLLRLLLLFRQIHDRRTGSAERYAPRATEERYKSAANAL